MSNPSKIMSVAGALVAAPFVFAVALVIRYGVNVPFWDQWEFVPTIAASRDGTLDFADFYAQHNEHRILFPNLATFALAQLSHWNIGYELAFSLTVAAITFGFLLLMLRRTLSPGWILAATAILASAIFFSPVQFENWLWGWQLEWFLMIAGLVVAIWALGAWRTTRPWRQVVVAIAAATLATFSLGSGMVVWLACLPLFLLNRRLWRWTALWLAAAAVEIVLYYTDYQAAAGDSGLGVLLRHPLDAVRYVGLYLAHPLLAALRPTAATAIAAGVLAMVVLGAGYVWLRHRAAFAGLLPWLCLAAFAVIAAAGTASSRLAYGIEQATASRYTSVSQLLTIAACVVAATVLQQTSARPEPASREADPLPARTRTAPGGTTIAARYLSAAALVVVTLLLAVNYPGGVSAAQGWHERLASAQQCARTVTSATDDCLLRLYPDKATVWQRLQYLRDIGWAPH